MERFFDLKSTPKSQNFGDFNNRTRVRITVQKKKFSAKTFSVNVTKSAVSAVCAMS